MILPGLSALLTTKRAKLNLLILLLLVSIVLRMTVAIQLGNDVAPVSGAHDQVTYDALALQVSQGQGFCFASNLYNIIY